MKYALIFVMVVVFLVVASTYLHDNPGYVEIGLRTGTYTMSLWYFLVAMVVAIAFLMLSLKLIWTVIKVPAILKRFGKRRHMVKANAWLQKGISAMDKGHWRKAENYLVKGAQASYKMRGDTSLFLTKAAEAAHRQGACDRRDDYLLEARQQVIEGADRLTTALSEARLYIDSAQYDKAVEVLKPHEYAMHRHPQLVTTLYEAQMQAGDYMAAWKLLAVLKKQLPSKAVFLQKQLQVATAVFSAHEQSLEAVDYVWRTLPKTLKKEESTALLYISALIHHDSMDKAEIILAKMIGASFSEQLIHAYTQLDSPATPSRLKKMQGWLAYQPDNAYLNYGVAKLAFELAEFDVAKTHVEQSITELPLPEALALLGNIHEALKRPNEALQAYKGTVKLLYENDVKLLTGDILPASNTPSLPEGA